MAYMGIDIGTTGCKAAVFDAAGRLLGSSYREYPLIIPRPGWAELDPEKVISACFAVIREAASQSGEPVEALAVSSQGEAFTPVAADGSFLGNAMVSSDVRAAEIAESWSKNFGKEKLYRITGHTAHPMFTVFKLLWLRDNDPQVWKQSVKCLCFEDLLAYKLGAEPAMGWPLAGRTMLFDVVRKDWNDEILQAVGIDRKQLAVPLASGSVAGTVSGRVAAELGLLKNAKIVTGGHDQTIGALGAGVFREGCAMYATGTVECITPAFSEAVFSDSLFRNNLCTYNYSLGEMFTTVAFSLTGGNLLKWFRDEFGQMEVEAAKHGGINAYELLMRDMPKTPSSLLALPYFTPTGTPYFDTRVTGAILGLRLSTPRPEILRALLEGVAMEMKLNLDILDKSGIVINELRAIGGGAKNRDWMQLKADILNKPVTTVKITEAGCLGAMVLAFAANAGKTPLDCAKSWVKTGETIQPNPVNAAIYAEKFETYQKLYPTLKSLEVNNHPSKGWLKR
ncbi:MAG: FGGY family carbohydrate kinase [Victivallales bacterium]|nr:FGGY family carbohydrate kinase [Victivallales bacterium]